jgi:hypothetical protein
LKPLTDKFAIWIVYFASFKVRKDILVLSIKK